MKMEAQEVPSFARASSRAFLSLSGQFAPPPLVPHLNPHLIMVPQVPRGVLGARK